MLVNIELSVPIEKKLQYKANKLGKSLNELILEILREEAENEVVEESEEYLLQQVSLGIPVEKWNRYHALIALRNAEQLTVEEHQTLIHISNEIETRNARRMPYIFRLAALRHVSPESLIQTLGIQ